MRFAAWLLVLTVAADAHATPATIWYSRARSAAVTDGTVWKVNGDGTGDVQVTDGEWPRLAPDGNLLLFHRDATDPARGNVYVRDLAMSMETKVFSNGDFLVHFDWNAASDKILFDSVCAIYESDADGTNVQSLISGDCYADAPMRNPVDARIVFHNQSGIAVAAANGASPTHVTNTQGGDYWAAWSTDGLWISFGRYSGSTAIDYYKVKPDGSELTQLTPFHANMGEGYGWRGIWTDDGANIIAPGTLFGVAGLYAIMTDGSGTVRRIATTAGNAPDFVGTVTSGTITGEVVLPTTTTTTSSTSTSSSSISSTSSSTTHAPTTTVAPTTTTTLVEGCPTAVTFESILCLLDALVTDVDASSDLGRLKTGILKAAKKARKQTGKAADAGTGKVARNGLKKAAHTLATFEHKLDSNNAKKLIPEATRTGFRQASAQIRSEIDALRGTL